VIVMTRVDYYKKGIKNVVDLIPDANRTPTSYLPYLVLAVPMKE